MNRNVLDVVDFDSTVKFNKSDSFSITILRGISNNYKGDGIGIPALSGFNDLDGNGNGYGEDKDKHRDEMQSSSLNSLDDVFCSIVESPIGIDNRSFNFGNGKSKELQELDIVSINLNDWVVYDVSSEMNKE